MIEKWPELSEKIALAVDPKVAKDCINASNEEIAPFLMLVAYFGTKKQFQEAAKNLVVFTDVRLQFIFIWTFF